MQQSFYSLNASAICTIVPHNWTSILIVLVFYEKCMLEKVTMQRTPHIRSFFFVIERTQLNAAHA